LDKRVQVYLVGGAVRDQILGYPFKDKDYLVTGANVEQMLDAGYQQVGKSFPVFLHPKTQHEYALARTEKKSGQGYTGFVCDFSPDITIEQDLVRRDLTINAMAQDAHGQIIDPFNGQKDLEEKRLRHVSDAFIEDPLRVLRVARFAARYHHLGFIVAEDTLALMSQMVSKGELDALIAERVWKETESALMERDPQVFFETLRQTGALKIIMPEVDALWGVPNPPKWHPEIDTGIHTMMVLKQAASLRSELPVRFAALTHDLGKALTPKDILPHHHGHEKLGLAPIRQLCERLKVPNLCRDLALLTSEFHTHTHKVLELKPGTLVKLFDKFDAWRKTERFEQFLQACTADMRGRAGFERARYEQADYLRDMLAIANSVRVKDVIAAGFKGPKIREELTARRINAIAEQKNLDTKKAQ